jgi:hypothetical protein
VLDELEDDEDEDEDDELAAEEDELADEEDETVVDEELEPPVDVLEEVVAEELPPWPPVVPVAESLELHANCSRATGTASSTAPEGVRGFMENCFSNTVMTHGQR